MSKWKHRLRGIKTEQRTAICDSCGPVRIKAIKRPSGIGWRCYKGHKEAYPTIYKRKAPIEPGACPICGVVTMLVWDHNHTTGLFRGYICGLCNAGLGMFKDNKKSLARAIEYLE